MPNYRAHLIASDGQIQQRVEFDCADDSSAREAAEPLVAEHRVQLWQGDRLVAIFRRQAGAWSGVTITLHKGRRQ